MGGRRMVQRRASRPASSHAHIRRLRQKLGVARDHVETVLGIGYRFTKQPTPPTN